MFYIMIHKLLTLLYYSKLSTYPKILSYGSMTCKKCSYHHRPSYMIEYFNSLPACILLLFLSISTHPLQWADWCMCSMLSCSDFVRISKFENALLQTTQCQFKPCEQHNHIFVHFVIIKFFMCFSNVACGTNFVKQSAT